MSDRLCLSVETPFPRRLLPLLLAAALPTMAGPAAAQLACGGTVGPGGTFTMTSDIVACASDPVLRVVGKTVLDMAGHRVICDGGSAFTIGISIEGKNATVKNGSVDGCNFGVGVFGDGQHKVRNVTVRRGLVGFAVSSDRNDLSGNGARQASADGFSINGSDNDLEDNAAVESPIGFLIQGLRNSFVRNVASENDVGFDASGSARSALTRNVAEGNTVGYRVAAASSDVTLKENVATGSDTGFEIGGSSHEISKNTAVNSKASGFQVVAGAGGHLVRDNVAIGTQNFDSSRGFLVTAANGNELRGNRAFNSFREGIAVSSQSNVIRDNVSLGNGLGLNDFNAGCDANVWTNNLGSKAQPCID
ncbi:MAG TPA: NosD domain-containing protein [Candidatus Binatia bacterium]|jgi:parallel beta-helix repeat protein|nr:NosD domain-containing protein [Candidatus Binatia bacterium]